MGRQVFTAGEILTAASMNDLGDQTVMVFDDATDRATAIPTPVEGMLTYLESVGGPGGLEVFDGTDFVTASPPITREALPAGTILQVVSTTKTDAFVTASTTPTAITGLSATITPSSASNKIMVFVDMQTIVNSNDAPDGLFRLLRNSTPIAVGDGVDSRSPASFPSGGGSFSATAFTHVASNLDQPNTTSAVTYSVDVRSVVSAKNVFVGRPFGNENLSTRGRFASTITVMEVAG